MISILKFKGQRDKGFNIMIYINRFILPVTLLITVVAVIIGLVQGKEQDAEFKEDYELHSQAQNYIATENNKKAIEMFSNLNEKYKSNYTILYDLARAHAALGNYKEAKSYFEEALRVRPFLQEESIFTYQYGKVLYIIGEYPKAKAYLEKSKEEIKKEYKSDIDTILNEIENKLGNR